MLLSVIPVLFLFAESVVASQIHSATEPSQPMSDERRQQSHSAVCYVDFYI